MKLTFNTMVLDVSTVTAPKTIKHYQAAEYYDAIADLQELLDIEPGNWEARLMIAACYYKTDQFLAAHRAFHYLSQRTTDEGIRARALEGLEQTNSKLDRIGQERPATVFVRNAPHPAPWQQSLGWF